jgi:hypothetical protein
MSETAAKRRRSKQPLHNSGKKPLDLWIDPSRLPKAKIHVIETEKHAEDYLMNRYLELADLVLKESTGYKKKKTA